MFRFYKDLAEKNNFYQLSSHSDLVDLNLDNQALGHIPDSISCLTQIQRLSLCNNSLPYISNFLELTNLNELVLANNLLDILPEELANLENLKLLNLNTNNFSTFPVIVCFLYQLEKFSIQSNKLYHIPSEIALLANLQILDVSKNHLNELPDELSQLTKLQELYASQNNLVTIPDFISDFIFLKKLDVSSNQLIFVSDNLSTLNLSHFNCSDNPLEYFHILFTSPESLCYLNLSKNKFIEFPFCIYQYSNLTELDFSFNSHFNSSILPDVFFSVFLHLKILRVEACNLTAFPPSLFSISTLTELRLGLFFFFLFSFFLFFFFLFSFFFFHFSFFLSSFRFLSFSPILLPFPLFFFFPPSFSSFPLFGYPALYSLYSLYSLFSIPHSLFPSSLPPYYLISFFFLLG